MNLRNVALTHVGQGAGRGLPKTRPVRLPVRDLGRLPSHPTFKERPIPHPRADLDPTTVDPVHFFVSLSVPRRYNGIRD